MTITTPKFFENLHVNFCNKFLYKVAKKVIYVFSIIGRHDSKKRIEMKFLKVR